MTRKLSEFFDQVRDALEGQAARKGYNDSGADAPNPVMEFGETHFPGHAGGEVLYKLLRYQKKGDPEDLIKAGAWIFLIWKYSNKS